MELLVPAAFLIAVLALAVSRSEARTLLLLAIPSSVGLVAHFASMAIPGPAVPFLGLVIAIWGMMLTAYLLQSSFAVAILVAAGAFALPVLISLLSGLLAGQTL